MISTAVHFLVGVGVVGGLLWGAAILARRFGSRATRSGPTGAGLWIVARRPISKGSALLRVSVEDRDLLVGASPKGIELLCDLPKTVPAALPGIDDSASPFTGVVASWKRRGFSPGPGADGYSLLPTAPDPGPQSGFAAMLQAATSRRRTGSRT